MTEQIISYDRYRIHMEKLTHLKNALYTKLEQFKILNGQYNTYLKANPYSKERHELKKEITKLRNKLIKEIPEKW